MRHVRRDTAGGGEIAMMAVITKAMGAFLVIMILLLPYYTSDPVAQRTADKATEHVDQAKQQLKQAQDTLGKGRLTDEEIDELLRKIEEALRQLDEALLNIRELKAQVDDLSARMNRLESEVEAQRREIEAQRQEIAELKEEIERLKEEIERLKRNQEPEVFYWNSVKLDWSGCADPFLNLYGASDQPDEKGNLNPPPDRTPQELTFSHDQSFSEKTEWRTDAVRRQEAAGSYTWVLDRLRVNEVVTFYVKYLNALPDGPNECALTARWRHWPAGDGKMNDTIRAKVTEKDPYIILVRLKAEERGSLVPQPVTDEMRQEFRKQIAASPCIGTTCGLADPNSREAFVNSIVHRFIGEIIPTPRVAELRVGPPGSPTERERAEAALRVLGEAYAAKKTSYADIAKWVAIVAEPAKSGGTETVSERVRELYAARLRQAGAPDVMVEMFRYRAQLALYSPGAIAVAFEKAGLGRVNLRSGAEAAERNAKQLLDQAIKDGMDPAIARSVSQIVLEGRVSIDTARSLLALIHEHRDSPKQDVWRSPAGQELQRALERHVGIGPLYAPLYGVLSPSVGRVPVQLALPLVRQIEAR
jgi:uncharacterized membrane protein